MKLPGFISRLFSSDQEAVKETNEEALARIERRRASSSGKPGMTINKLLEGVDDSFYLWLLTDGQDSINSEALKALLPTMPDEQTQRTFTGKSGKAALDMAFGAFEVFKQAAADNGVVLDGSRTVLDFGCGWGRIIRLFMKDVEPSALYGVDANPKIIETCMQSNIGANFEAIKPMPPTQFKANTFDVIYLYSVFSHLSEEACDGWLAEFKRILKPGGVLLATTRPRSFIVYCGKLRQSEDIKIHGLGAAKAFPDTEKVLADYDAGKFCFSPGSSGVLDKAMYGESAIPKKYVEDHWTKYFSHVDFIPEEKHRRFDQNLIVARKDPRPKIAGPIVVYNMGKVGSRTVFETLVDMKLGVDVFHAHVLHDLDKMAEAIKKQFANPVNSLAVIEQGKRLRKSIDEDQAMCWNLITLVRDPVAQTISRFFQSIEEVMPDIRERVGKGTVSKEEIMDAFMTKWPRLVALTWFERQFEPVFGIDVFDHPFPSDKGYDIIRKGRFSVLILRLEDLDKCAVDAFDEFLSIPDIDLKKTNVGSDKWYKDIYRVFMSEVVLTDEYLDEVYGSALARHFYTPDELKAFRARWKM